mmetsp:Transcript_2060/g.3995  ORF Transcript_2060/g.3995 Transcript_2060/m.3995 type:complete len:373 (+) Transcript_2060:265-1383(+)
MIPESRENDAWSTELLRQALQNSNDGQTCSPASTFTDAQKEKLQSFLPNMHVHGKAAEESEAGKKKNNNQLDILEPWTPVVTDEQQPKKSSFESNVFVDPPSLDWHGAPRFESPAMMETRQFRQKVRQGLFTGPTNAVCPGFLQCNLVILPQGKHAFDFLLFCQRNPKACPLIEVCEAGSPVPVGVAPDADLRTDCPKYAIYRDGKLDKEVTDITEYWPENAVAFLIGCSFSYDGALINAGIPLRSAEAGRNVPMYKTSLKCRSAGSLSGNIVVSMKPIPALQVAKHVEITSKFPHAHGGPVCIGRPDVIGIQDMDKPDWGDSIDLRADEVPVFHACGVTPQSVLMDSKVPFAITHAPGHMFVTDLDSSLGS